MEVTYSKKQIRPLIEKFSINAETNKVFRQIILMFNEQTPYQIWAIKLVFGENVPIQSIQYIKEWAERNQTEIHNLIKGNIVSYKKAEDIKYLLIEMQGAEKLKLVKNFINQFNTDQKNILSEHVLSQVRDFTSAYSSRVLGMWHDIFKQVATLPEHRLHKLISTASALRDVESLKSHIENALKATYSWEKNDMLSFMARNCSDCKLVYDNENIVIVTVPSFSSSKKLCGGGRTGWCLTREERYFKQYVGDYKDNKQFFFFDFSKREDHELAHIGFTVRQGQGIVNAHSTRNSNLCGDGIRLNGKLVNIHQALELAGVPKHVYINLKELKEYKWDVEAFLAFLKKNETDISVSVATDNRFVVRPLTQNGLQKLLAHTLIDLRNFQLGTDKKAYVFLDFNKNQNEDDSIIAVSYTKDMYKMDTLSIVKNAYNIRYQDLAVLSKVNITSEMFLNREHIDPKILLHKLIDEHNEVDAIKLIESEGDDFNVNYVFNEKYPIFNAISHNMFGLFEKLINHRAFDFNTSDPLGEKILHCLLYMYNGNNSDEDKSIKKMIDIILNSTQFDFNSININDDTPINIAAENPKLLWVLEKLLAKPNININVVNDFNCAALGNAIRKKNLEALKLIGQRPDLVIREEDLELADEYKINLKDYINPTVLSKEVVKKAPKTEDELSFLEIFNKALKACQE